ncbi:MAG: DUF4186 domain-containing protein [Planctomycetota bacterium]|jgi:hypothetical protein
MRELDEIFAALEKSKFRSQIKLKDKDAVYLKQKGMPVVLEHARDFVTKRLAPANPPNDGKQTPMKNHPVFIAQHATGTCCRKCLQKWHDIPKGEILNPKEIDYIVSVIGLWLKNQAT